MLSNIFDIFTGNQQEEQQAPQTSMWDGIVDGLGNVGSAVGSGLETVGEYAGQGLSHAFERLQDPEFQQQLQLFGAAMSDDNTRYQSALNSYDARRQEIAKQKREDMQRAQQREEKLSDLKEQRQYSEQQSYLSNFTPESVQAFKETGDQSVLARAKQFRKEEDRSGNVWEVEVDAAGNDVDSGVRRIVDYAAQKEAKQSRTQVVDGILYEEFGPNDWRPVTDARDKTPAGGEGVTLGDGQVVNEPGMYELSDGTLVKVEKAATGKFSAKIPSANEREGYRVKNTAANQSLVDDFDLVKNSNLSPEDIELLKKEGKTIPTQANGFYITGVTGDQGEAPLTSNILTKVAGSDTDRAVKVAADRIDASMTNMGVAEAKAMGASGINTIAEVKQFAASMPKLDRSSTKALQASIKKIDTYVQAWNADRAKTAPTRKVGSTQEQTSSQRYPDGTVLEKGGKRYVVQGGKPVLQ